MFAKTMLSLCDAYEKDKNNAYFIFVPFYVPLNKFSKEQLHYFSEYYGNTEEFWAKKSIGIVNLVLCVKEKGETKPTYIPIFVQGFCCCKVIFQVVKMSVLINTNEYKTFLINNRSFICLLFFIIILDTVQVL